MRRTLLVLICSSAALSFAGCSSDSKANPTTQPASTASPENTLVQINPNDALLRIVDFSPDWKVLKRNATGPRGKPFANGCKLLTTDGPTVLSSADSPKFQNASSEVEATAIVFIDENSAAATMTDLRHFLSSCREIYSSESGTAITEAVQAQPTEERLLLGSVSISPITLQTHGDESIGYRIAETINGPAPGQVRIDYIVVRVGSIVQTFSYSGVRAPSVLTDEEHLAQAAADRMSAAWSRRH